MIGAPFILLTANKGIGKLWIGDEYRYSPKMLSVIADNYSLYDPESLDFNSKRWQEAIEYKADFDQAFCILSKRGQTVVMVEAHILEKLGYYNVDYFKFRSFGKMAEYLNGCMV